MREVFNGLRYIIKISAQWRQMPHDLPPWPAIYQQAQRWLPWGCFDVLIDDLRKALGRLAEPSAAIIDARTLRSSPESGGPAMTGTSARRSPSCTSRWIKEHSFAWATRCRRLVRNYERYATTLAGWHLVAFVYPMLRPMALPAAGS
jgi:transposase